MKAAKWVLILGCWLLVLSLLGRAAYYAYEQEFLKVGPARIVGARNVIYCEAGGFMYTNPGAMMGLHLRCFSILFGIALLTAGLATVSIRLWKWLAWRRVCSRLIPILFGIVMILAFLYLAVLCVWELALCWLAVLICARFAPKWSSKGIFTIAVLIAVIALMGFCRMELESTERMYEAFWNDAKHCVTVEDFIARYDAPVLVRRHLSEDDKKWFYDLANFDSSHWLSGKNLYGFVSPNIPYILLLPWFDDDGKRAALAWCDLTPERQAYITERTPKTE